MVATVVLPGQGFTKRQRYQQFLKQLVDEAATHQGKWRDLSDYVLNDRSRFIVQDAGRGDVNTNKIIDSTATESADTLAAGLATGATPVSSPWYDLGIPDRDLEKYGPVKLWLEDTAQDMRDIMLSTNVYLALHTLYGDLGVFGVSPMAIEEDVEKVARCTVHPIGSYYLACNERDVVDTFGRQYQVTVRQAVRRWGFDNCSRSVQDQWTRGQLQNKVEVAHLIMPNEGYRKGSPLAKDLPFSSCYFEVANVDDDSFLSESGFEENPIVAPRWSVKPGDVYGKGPGHRSLPDVKALQNMHKQMALSIELANKPPMVASPALRNKRLSLLPADVTFADERDGRLAFRPAMEAKPDIGPMMEGIADHRSRIRRAFHADLFLMQTLDARSQPPTAEEIRARETEKLLQLGPVYNRLSDELYDPLIARFFGIMVRRRLIRKPPPELRGMPLKVRYTNIMAQAQRQVGVGAIERIIGFVAANGEIFPELRDAIKPTEAALTIADKLGVPARIMRTPDEIAALQQGRAKQQQVAEQSALAEQMAKTGKTLAETPTTGDTALAKLGGVLASRPSAEA